MIHASLDLDVATKATNKERDFTARLSLSHIYKVS